ncbi:hypothetical protein Ddye_016292 [Dipteronia dyeriana]|uniref:PPIase cyclophilin-type domain-containing protein n=1 Tax=Dipteronia dyeriana TaxID=168575 RepID=A0AAD9U770_9ROSI|nr:hypothetical protein Ddye_016292 [Dipteronia dyeriana]
MDTFRQKYTLTIRAIPCKSVNRKTLFFNLSIDNDKTGRIVMELFADSTLIKAKNFRALCIGEKRMSTVGKPLHYKGSTFYCVVLGYVVHGGDITHRN